MYSNNKLAQNDVIEKNTILLGISRKLFTHSLPLVVAEQCYIKLLKDTRALIVDTRIPKKREKAYELFEKYDRKIVIKANDSFQGKDVYLITEKNNIKPVIEKIFSEANDSLSICPFEI